MFKLNNFIYKSYMSYAMLDIKEAMAISWFKQDFVIFNFYVYQ